MKTIIIVCILTAGITSGCNNNENAGNKTDADRDMLIDTTLSAPATSLDHSRTADTMKIPADSGSAKP